MSKTVLSQFASSVVNFSSQYGTKGTDAYVAKNLAGKPRLNEGYGDYIEAFVLRTYGPWWQRCPSARTKLKKTAPNFQSEDFVELEYVTPVIPTKVLIYETYNPGSVVRILACNSNKKMANTPGKVEWVTLWSGKPQCSQIPQKFRKFSPPLKNISFPTSLIRLEFNSVECQYYTELDAVELIGYTENKARSFKDRAVGFQMDLTTRLIRQLSLTDRQNSITSQDEDECEKWGYFALLPDELIQKILSYLDVISLSNVSQTCSLLLKNAYDPLLYTDLDLQSRWNTVDDVALRSLVDRCCNLQRLNLSWTGGGGQITEDAVCSFLENCGSELRTLRLACCQYITEKTIRTISQVCTNLEELDLQSCMQLENRSLEHISRLHSLKGLNLYCIALDPDLFDTIGKCNKLEHLNLGALVRMSNLVKPLNYDRDQRKSLCKCLTELKNLISLDLWRFKIANEDIIFAIAENCPNFQELDVGWCNFHCPLDMLCSKCPKLKKLYLTSGRSISDSDLKVIAKHCHDLEQLDILGTNVVSVEGVTRICKKCPKMFFFDISFCGGLKDNDVTLLRQTYPHINFKKSFQ